MQGRPKGSKNKTPIHIWTDDEKKYLSEIAYGKSREQIAELMSEKFGFPFTKGQIKGALYRDKISTGLTGRFEKGHVPYNKGTKGICKPNSGSFTKGQKAINARPVGSERVNADGYIEIKIKDDGPFKDRWALKHRVVYEEHYGPIPKGSAIIFGDGDKSNLSIDNLILVTRSQLARLNQNHLIQDDVELTKTAINVVDLMCKISQVKKSNKR